jgi:hypothetical protein
MFIIFLTFSSKVLAQEVCNNDVSIDELKKELINLQKIRDESERGIIESDKKLMKAQEIILLARANRDIEAGKKAEEIVRKAEEIIRVAEQTKNKHLKNKQKAEEEIEDIKQYIDIAGQNNFQCMSEVCNKFREQIARDKEALKRLLKEAETLSKRQEEREKKLLKEKLETQKDLLLSILPDVLSIVHSIKKLWGSYGNIGRLGKGIQNLINSPKIKEPKTKEKLWKIGDTIRQFNIYLDKHISEDVELISQGIETGSWSSNMYPKIAAYLKLMFEDNEYIKNYLEDLKKDLYELANSQETKELLGDLVLSETLSELEKLSNEFKKAVTKLAPLANAFHMGINIGCLWVKIDYLDSEVNRDYKLTDDLLKSYERLKDQLDKDMKKLKECENYSKKLSEKEESNE